MRVCSRLPSVKQPINCYYWFSINNRILMRAKIVIILPSLQIRHPLRVFNYYRYIFFQGILNWMEMLWKMSISTFNIQCCFLATTVLLQHTHFKLIAFFIDGQFRKISRFEMYWACFLLSRRSEKYSNCIKVKRDSIYFIFLSKLVANWS